MNLGCKPTFRDSGLKKNPSKETSDMLIKHHWVHRWKLEGRCQACSKSFQQKMFRDKVGFVKNIYILYYFRK
jgi:pterin-4a-carbinolamine dehydratase